MNHKKQRAEILEEALRRIKSSDFRLTQPRRKLLEAVVAQTEPFSVATLEKALARRDGGFDLVTIYRSLPVLETLGIIEKCGFSEGVAFFEVTLNQHGHHHHIVCTECKKVEHLDFCVIEAHEAHLRKLGYTSLKHRLEFTGTCRDCAG